MIAEGESNQQRLHTLAASQRGQSEHLLKGECVIFWVLDAQDFG